MRKIVLLVFCSCLVSLLSAQRHGLLLEKAEEGVKYVKCRSENPKHGEYQEDLIWKISPPQYEAVLDTVYKDSLVSNGKGSYRVQVSDTALKWDLLTNLNKNCLSANPDDCFGLRKLAVQPIYRTIKFKEDEHFLILKIHRLRIPTSIQLVDLPFPDLEEGVNRLSYTDANDVLYIKTRAGFWTEWREFLCTASHATSMSIRQVQEALLQKGYYNGPVDDIMNEETKNAIIKFQKDRKLPVGNLDLQTLKNLGLIK